MAFTYRMTTQTGREVEFDYPTQLSRDEAQQVAEDLAFRQEQEQQVAQQQAAAEQQQKSEDYGIFSTDFLTQDVPLTALESMNYLPKLIGEAATAMGSDEFGPNMLKDVKQYEDRIQGMRSEGYKARQAQNALERAQADGEFEKALISAKQMLTQPVMATQEIGRMAPELMLTGMAGRAATGLGLGAKAGTGAAMATGAGLQAGDVLGDIYQTVYDGEIAKGTPQEEAVSKALSLARERGAEMFGISMATMMLPGGTALERALAGTSTGKGLISGAVKGFLGEGAQEATEETTGQLFKNLAQQQYDPSMDVTSGLGETAGQAFALGSVLGGPAGGIGGMRGAQDEARKQAEQQAAATQRESLLESQTGAFQPLQGQLSLPGMEQELQGPQVPVGGLPVEETPMPEGPAPQQLDMFEPTPAAPEKPDNWFPELDPAARIERIDQELGMVGQDPVYNDFSPKELKQVQASLNRARKEAVAQRQEQRRIAAEDAKKAEGSAFTNAEMDLFGVAPTQAEPTTEQPIQGPQQPISEVFGGPQQELFDRMPQNYSRDDFIADAGVNQNELGQLSGVGQTFNNTMNSLVGLDLAKPEDRQQAIKILNKLDSLKRPSKWATNLIPKVQARLDAAQNQALQTALEEMQAQDQAAREQAQKQAGREQQVSQVVQEAVQEGLDLEQRSQQVTDRYGKMERMQAKADTAVREKALAEMDQEAEAAKAAQMEEAWAADARATKEAELRKDTDLGIMQQEAMDRELAGFELDLQVVDDTFKPDQKPAAIATLDAYNRAVMRGDKKAANKLDNIAKESFGDLWTTAKRASTVEQTRQRKSLQAEIAGDTKKAAKLARPDLTAKERKADGFQMDLFAEQGREQKAVEDKARAEAEAARAEEVRKADAQAVKEYKAAFKAANNKSKQSGGAVKVASGDYVYKGYQIEKDADGVWNVGKITKDQPVREFDDAADSLSEAKAIVDNYVAPEAKDERGVRKNEVREQQGDRAGQRGGQPSVAVPERQDDTGATTQPTAPAERVLGGTTRPAGRNAGRARPKPAPLEGLEGQSLQMLEADLYATQAMINEETDREIRSDLNNRKNQLAIEYIRKQTGQYPLREELNETLTAVRNDEPLPVYEKKEQVDVFGPTRRDIPAPKSLGMIGLAETQKEFSDAVDQAVADGYFSQEEAAGVKRAFGQGALGDIVAKEAVLKRVKDTLYFQNNPEGVNRWLEFLRNERKVAETAELDLSRTPFQTREPKSQVADLTRKFNKLISRLGKNNKVNVVQSTSDLPVDVPSDVRGMYYQGEVYVVADNVSELDFEEVVAHEAVGHMGLETMLGKQQFMSLLKTVRALKDSNPRIQRVLDNIKTAYTNEQGAYTLDETQEAREILAHIAQERTSYLNAGPVMRAYNAIASKVRQFLMNLGFTKQGDFLLDQLIYEAALHVEGGRNANRKGRTFLRSGSEAQALMQRAWDLGYRGYNLNSAGAYLRGVHSGDTQVAARNVNDILDSDVNDDFLDTAAFSRKPIDPNTVDPKYRSFIREQEDPKSKFLRMRETLMGGMIRNAIDRFRVSMVDSAAVIEDKIMRLYNNAVTKDGLINPMVSYVQALKADALSNGFMRTGVLRLREDGLWDTSVQAGDNPTSLVDVYKKIAEFGKRIGSTEVAANVASDVFVARRELEIYDQNEKLEAQAVQAENNGKKALARELRAKIKDIFLTEQDGRPRPMTDGELQAHLANQRALIREHWDTTPELREAFDMFTEFKNNMLTVAKDTGFITEEKMDQWMDSAAYVPFYRIKDNMDERDLRRGGTGMMDIETMKQLRGSAKEVGNVLDNMAELTMWMTNSIIRNHGSKELVRGLEETGGVKARYNSDKEAPNDAVLVTYYEDGKQRYVEPIDPLDAYAWRGMENATIPALKMLGTGAEWLRKGITLSPDFILSQLEQDSFRAYGFSGVKNPFKAARNVVPSFIRVRKELAAGEMGNAELNKLGILGMYDISPEHTREQVEMPFRGDQLTGFQKLIRWGERNAEASDLAQRLAIYEQTLAEGGSEVEAFWRASEVINFSRRGNSLAATFLRQVVPFQNAYAQGMSILGKTLVGRGLSQLEKKQAFLTFARAGMKLSLLSTLAAIAMADDDDYANQPDHLRSRYFMMPSPYGDGFLKLAMPADLGFLFKHIPETIVMSAMRKDGDSEKRIRETTNAFMGAVMGPNMMPQLIKPTAEAFFNYSFFTGGPIVGLGESQLTTDKQYRENTSLLARAFGEIGISPLKADHILRGTFGTVGAYGLLATDLVGEAAFGIERTNREAADYPIAKTLFSREQGSAFKTDFYQLRDQVRSLVTTKNLLVREGRKEELQALYADEDNRTLLSLQTAVNKIDKTIKDSNQRIKKVQASNMSGERKRELIDAERARQARLSAQITRMRQYANQ